MAVSFVGSVGGFKNDGTDVTLDLSGLSLQENDVVYVSGGSAGFSGGVFGTAGIETAGYTELANGYTDLAGAATVQRKVMGATPDSSVVCSGGGTNGLGCAYLAMAFRGVDTTTPEDVATVDNDDGIDPPSIDPVTDDCGILIFGLDAATSTLAAPTGYGDLDQASSSAGSANYTIAGAWKLLTGSAAEDPGAFTGGSAAVYAATIALRPAAGGGGAVHRPLMMMGVG